MKLGLVGTGAMGRGIAQLFAQSGHTVVLFDTRSEAVPQAIVAIAQVWGTQVAKGKLTSSQSDQALARLVPAPALSELSDCDLIIEAIAEDLAAKQQLFLALESVASADCILATNTSSLSVTAIASGCQRPERVAGLHFFNPVPLMKLVEVIGGIRTAPAVCDTLTTLVSSTGHLAVRATDTPGFIVNHAGRGFGTEALRVLHECVTDIASVDAILRDQAGFRLGPFELMDLTALDVSHPVMESIYHQYFEEPRYRPSPITALRLAGGLLGRKSNGGFYSYADGVRIEPVLSAPPATAGLLDNYPQQQVPVYVAESNPAQALRLTNLLQNISGVVASSIDNAAIIFIAPLGVDASQQAATLGLDARRVVALDLLIDDAASKRRVLMTTPATLPEVRDAAWLLLSSATDHKPVSVISDSAGFVTQRVLCTIVNIACDMCQQQVCSPAALDQAARLALGYPQGPLAWGDALGASRVLKALDGIYACTQDPRYRASPWLRRRAQLGLSLSFTDNGLNSPL